MPVVPHFESVPVNESGCRVQAGDEPFVEVPGGFSVSYAPKGSFGPHTRRTRAT
jgi:hypothetical protein